MPKTLFLPALALCMLLGGCVYKIDVDQGNLLPADAVAQLKPGMTPQQVRFLLGTPAIVDPFHPERWDYVYSEQKGGGARVERRLTLRFENDRLTDIERGPERQGKAQGLS